MTATGDTEIRIGTRGSALALVQAGLVADALRDTGRSVRLDTIVTDGDRHAVDTPWGEGAFVTAIEGALRDGRVDIAVHSAKDLPVDEDPGLRVAAYLPREAPDDVLVMPSGRAATSLADLPVGARVGTDSPRRTAFLRAARPDLDVHPLHGNVDTRLRRLDAGETDALVLAAAGLHRLRRAERISHVLPMDVVLPAPGQGALAIQVRADDQATGAAVAALDHAPTRRAVEAERALLAAAGGGCRAPIGALGSVADGDPVLRLRVGYATADGRVLAMASAQGSADAEVVRHAMEQLTAHATAAAESGLGAAPRVVITRVPERAGALHLALIDRGFVPVDVPCIAIEPVDPPLVDAALDRTASVDWVVITSVHAVLALREAAARRGTSLQSNGTRWAVVGAATEHAARDAGIDVAHRSPLATGAALADSLPSLDGQTVLLPRGDLADETLPARLAARGGRVESVVVYRTVEAPASSRRRLETAMARRPRAVIMTSGSTVRGWLALSRAAGLEAAARSVGVVAIGPSTTTEARAHGLRVIAEAATPRPVDVADAVRAAILDDTEAT